MNTIKNYILFWILNVFGWFILFAMMMLMFYSNKLTDFRVIISIGITYLLGFLITLFMRYLYRRINFKKKSFLHISFVIIIVSVIFSHIWFYSDAIISTYFLFSDMLITRSFLYWEGVTIERIPIMIAWSGIYFVVKIWQEWNQEKEHAEKADLLAQKAQLQMLRYQLNPHFLFNVLNSIRALIEEDKEKAKEVITTLSEFLRYTLVSRNLIYVPFKNELEAIKQYFNIQKIRYEEKLEIHYDIDDEAEDFQVLSFSVYPLVENAVKYGMKTSTLPLKIWIFANIFPDSFTIEIKNTGKWIETNLNNDTGTGTGLENVKKRLSNAFPGKHSFKIDKSEDTVSVIIKIFKDEKLI